MWGQLSMPWQIAIGQAWTAYCAGSLPIGAVIVSPQTEVIAEGRNRVYDAAVDGDPLQLRHHFMAHAEQNAFLSLGFRHREKPETKQTLASYSLYTTLEPCDMCLGTLIQSGLKSVYYLIPDPVGGAVETLTATAHVRQKDIMAQVAQPGPAADIALAWMIVTMVKGGMAISAETFPLPAAYSKGFALGKVLAQSGDLDRFSFEQMPVSSVYDVLFEQLQNLPPVR